jgi:hypothetical protein
MRVSRRSFTMMAALAGGLAPWSLARAAQVELSADDAAILDGTKEINVEGLADLAKERAHLGALWLAGVIRSTGAFYYIYNPGDDEYVKDSYNEVRHSGTTFSMYQAFELTQDQAVLAAADMALEYIDENSLEIEGHGRAYIDLENDTTSIGGQALSLLAVLERRRVTGETNYDGLIEDLGKFLLAMEMTDEPGRYFFSYDHPTRKLSTEPDVVYYPGECLLALTRLAQQFPDGPYLDAAKRAAQYLVYERDGNLPAIGEAPREDHWLTIALGELYRLNPDPGYQTVAYLIADLMISKQYTADDGYPDKIGGARKTSAISYTSTATKGEAIVAAWALAKYAADQPAIDRFALAAQRNAQFQMRVQYTELNTELFPTPSRLIGGWPGSPVDQSIRIDYVQHNISVLIELWHMVKEGDIKVASA